MARNLKVLVLHRNGYQNRYALNLQVYFRYHPDNFYYFHDIYAPFPSAAKSFEWDLVIFSYCCMSRRADGRFEEIKEELSFLNDVDAAKIAFPQDDYINFETLDDWLFDLNVDMIYSPLDKHLEYLYKKNHNRIPIVHCYTSYLDDLNFEAHERWNIPFSNRPIDFGNRINALPATYGRHGMLKGQINLMVGKLSAAEGMQVDISTNHADRFFGDDWLKFLGRVKFTAAAKGGVSVADPDGSVHRAVASYKAHHPDAGFEEIEANCFPNLDGKYMLDAIGPRLLQASEMGVCQLLVEDNYPGGLEPWKDYIPVKKDLSNWDDILKSMRDEPFCAEIAANGRKTIMNHKGFHFSTYLDGIFDNARNILASKRVDARAINPNLSGVNDMVEDVTSEFKSYLAPLKGVDSATENALLLILHNISKDDVTRALTIIANCKDKKVRLTNVYLTSIGYNSKSYSGALQSLLSIYFDSENNEMRNGIEDLLNLKLANKLKAGALRKWRYEFFTISDTRRDLRWDEERHALDYSSLFVLKKKKHAANHLDGKPLHLLNSTKSKKELSKSFNAINSGATSKKTVALFTDSNFPGHPGFHTDALLKHGYHNYFTISPINTRNTQSLRLDHFDAIVIDYSILLNRSYYLSHKMITALREFKGPICVMQQDEYRWVSQRREFMQMIGVDCLISSLTPDNMRQVYGDKFIDSIVAIQNLPGFLSESIIPDIIPELEDRPHIICGRTWNREDFQPYYGKYMHRKVDISDAIFNAAIERNLSVDMGVGVGKRVYGKAWGELLASSRGHVCVEGGSTMFDLDTLFEPMYENYRLENPYASNAEIYEELFAIHENNVVHKVLTPRCFEAARLRTAIIGYKGEYSGLLNANEDYIVVKDDHSNINEVLDILENTDKLRTITDSAYKKIGSSDEYTYKAHATRLDALIDVFFDKASKRKKPKPSLLPDSLLKMPKIKAPKKIAKEKPEKLVNSEKLQDQP